MIAIMRRAGASLCLALTVLGCGPPDPAPSNASGADSPPIATKSLDRVATPAPSAGTAEPSAAPPVPSTAGQTPSAHVPSSLGCPDGMAAIAGGTFKMGADDGAKHEKPVRDVKVRPFCMDITEVTVGAYADCPRCIEPATGEWCTPFVDSYYDRGRNCVSWVDATTYCAWVGKQLPTEAQWEYAARGGSQALKYPWGSREPMATDACWNRPGPCAPGEYPAGPFGLHDMAGGLSEWVSEPYGPGARSVRGASWSSDDPSYLRGAHRSYNSPEVVNGTLGFRCATTR